MCKNIENLQEIRSFIAHGVNYFQLLYKGSHILVKFESQQQLFMESDFHWRIVHEISANFMQFSEAQMFLIINTNLLA